MAKFNDFGKYLKIFGNTIKVYLVLHKVFNSLWNNLYAIGQIFIDVNGQMLKLQSDHLVTLFDIISVQTSEAERDKLIVIKYFFASHLLRTVEQMFINVREKK